MVLKSSLSYTFKYWLQVYCCFDMSNCVFSFDNQLVSSIVFYHQISFLNTKYVTWYSLSFCLKIIYFIVPERFWKVLCNIIYKILCYVLFISFHCICGYCFTVVCKWTECMGTRYATVMADVWIRCIVYSSSGMKINILFTEPLNSYYVRISSTQTTKIDL